MIVARFREIVARHGARIAIEDGARCLTYEALDARAEAIAGALRGRGVERDDVVAVRTDDRVAIACGMLGVWYAGSAFLVVTRDIPEARAERMMRDAGVVAIADDALLNGDLPHKKERVVADVGRDALAYVVFTSGTTGNPKGVLVTHAGLVPMLDAQVAAFALEPGARAAWTLSPLFDASISDVWTALISGATLVAHEGLARLAPRAMFERMGELAITHADVPPSVLALACDALPASLRTVIIGGEACAEHVVRRVAARVRLVNVYGPTEATVCTSLHVCDADARHGARIGMPVPGVVYRVEEDELLIGGAAVARGYAGDEALTALRFVEREGMRFYRTGDRVRVRDATGELEIVGRVDRQVKIAGVRIEPEEIESRLRDDASVVDCAVVPVAGKLRAFVVLAEGATLEAVRDRFAHASPAWLVPARFAALEAMPRTATGKVDFAALVALATAEDARTNDVAPTSGVVGALCEAMAEALGVDALGRDADFVAHGGDSFAALVACAAADVRGIIVSPETIIAERTPARVAASTELRGMTTEALASDIERLCAHVETRSGPSRAALVTGATGALGARLVVALARVGVASTCLVRAHSDEAATSRLADALGCDTLPPNVRAIAGDVSRPRFGLTATSWAALAAEHDAIVHAAAELALTAPYAMLRATNVLGTAHALDFAREGAPKAFHHVSTLSVFASTDLARSGRTFGEDDSLHSARIVHGGYAQSKWAAEALVRACAPNAHVLRLGLLLPARGRDLFGAFVRGVAALGLLPDDDALRFDVTPSAIAAEAIARFVVAPGDHRTKHVAHRVSASIDDLAHALALAENGISVARAPLGAFRERVGMMRGALDGLALASFRALDPGDALRAFDLFEATNVDLGAARTHEELARAGIVFPAARDVLVDAVRDALARPR